MPRAPASVEIRLLGGFEVRLDGEPVAPGAWPGRRAKELVQLLALAPDRTLLSDQVLEALWPHLDPPAAAANLRKAAHHARRALGEPKAVVLRGGSVRLLPEHPVTTDVEQFEAGARAALASSDPVASAAAAACYEGDLLPEARYEEWTILDRARLRALQVQLLGAAGQWREVVELDPTDEAAYQALMRDALATGARSAAIRWYAQLRTALADELGVAPSEATEALYAECLEGLETTAPSFVGRDVGLAEGRGVLRNHRSTTVDTILVRATAGLGKTAFCHELARLAEADGWTCVRMEAGEIAAAYGPVRTAIEAILAEDPALLDALPDPTRVALAAVTPLAGDGPATGPISRHQVIGALRRLLRAVSADQPVLVVLDDAHTADDATVDTLVQLAAAGGSIVVVLAARPPAADTTLDRAVTRLERAQRLVVVDLPPLDSAEVAALARHAAPDELPDTVVDRIVEVADGSPFITIELARRGGAEGPAPLDTELSHALTSRLVDLDAEAVALLERLALVGDALDTSTVVALAGGDEPAAFSVLDRALEAGVLVAVGGRYRFRHELVRRALIDRTAPHERLLVHREAADRLAASGAPPEVVAHHWIAGGRGEEAVPFLLTAAQRAMGMGAFTDAVATLDTLLQHEPGHPTARQLRAEALDVLGDLSALAAYDDAIEAAPSAEVDDLRAKRALAQLKQGDPVGALDALEGVAPRSVDGKLAEALTYSGAAALGFTDPATGTARSAECRAAALRTGDAAAIVVASWSNAAAAHARGELRESVLADLRDTSTLPHLATRVFDGQLCVTQRLLYGSRPYDDVIAFADGLAAEAVRLGAARGHAFGVTLRGEAELLSGRLDDAERDLLEAARLHRELAGPTGEALATQRLAELALCRGEVERAHVLLDDALDLARSSDVGFHLLDRIYGTRIAAASASSRALAAVEEAEDAVRGTLETCPGCRITFAVPAAIATARAGDLERAEDHAGAAEFLADVVMRLPAWSAALDEVRGHLARARGDEAEARRHLATAADRFRAAEHPLDAARCDAALHEV